MHEDKGQSTEPHPMVEFSTLNLEGGREGGRRLGWEGEGRERLGREGGRESGRERAREGGWEGEWEGEG